MRRVSEPHRKAIGEEINRLTEANFIRETTNHNILPDARKETPEADFDTSSDTRAHQVHPTDPSKTALVSKDLDPK